MSALSIYAKQRNNTCSTNLCIMRSRRQIFIQNDLWNIRQTYIVTHYTYSSNVLYSYVLRDMCSYMVGLIKMFRYHFENLAIDTTMARNCQKSMR